jgi:hypothetical protein
MVLLNNVDYCQPTNRRVVLGGCFAIRLIEDISLLSMYLLMYDTNPSTYVVISYLDSARWK